MSAQAEAEGTGATRALFAAADVVLFVGMTAGLAAEVPLAFLVALVGRFGLVVAASILLARRESRRERRYPLATVALLAAVVVGGGLGVAFANESKAIGFAVLFGEAASNALALRSAVRISPARASFAGAASALGIAAAVAFAAYTHATPSATAKPYVAALAARGLAGVIVFSSSKSAPGPKRRYRAGAIAMGMASALFGYPVWRAYDAYRYDVAVAGLGFRPSAVAVPWQPFVVLAAMVVAAIALHAWLVRRRAAPR